MYLLRLCCRISRFIYNAKFVIQPGLNFCNGIDWPSSWKRYYPLKYIYDCYLQNRWLQGYDRLWIMLLEPQVISVVPWTTPYTALMKFYNDNNILNNAMITAISKISMKSNILEKALWQSPGTMLWLNIICAMLTSMYVHQLLPHMNVDPTNQKPWISAIFGIYWSRSKFMYSKCLGLSYES